MRRKVLFFLPVVVLALLTLGYAQLQPVGPDNTPKVGEKAPDFELAKGLNPTTPQHIDACASAN